jgi:phosphatidylglycerophosphate synthase
MKDFAPPESEGLKEALVIVWKNAQKDRYKIIGNWKFDRWIFTVAMLLIFGWLLFVGWSFNWELDYFSCGEVSEYYNAGVVCVNPFYEPLTWKNSETLIAGEYGVKPGPLFKSVYYVPVFVLLIVTFINYLLYNRRRWKE